LYADACASRERKREREREREKERERERSLGTRISSLMTTKLVAVQRVANCNSKI